MTPSAPRALTAFLAQAFLPYELRLLLLNNADDAALDLEIPECSSRTQAASALVDALSRHGRIDPDFFQALVNERPARAAEIRAIAAQWGSPRKQVWVDSSTKAMASVLVRPELVERIGDLLRDRATRVVVLTGPPGVGKTTLAAAYATNRASDHLVLWIHAGVQGMDAGLAAKAQALGLPVAPGEATGELVEAVLRTLGHDGRSWLLIVDDLPEPEAALTLAGRLAACSVLVTTRATLPSGMTRIGVAPPSAEASAEFLAGDAAPGASFIELARKLGCLPLALDAARRLLSLGVTSADELIEDLNNEGPMVLGEGVSALYDQILSPLVPAREPDATALRVCAALGALAPHPVPRELLAAALGVEDEGTTGRLLRRGLEWLVCAGLIWMHPQDRLVCCHQLVQGYFSRRCRLHEQFCFDALTEKLSRFDDAEGRIYQLSRWEPHLDHLARRQDHSVGRWAGLRLAQIHRLRGELDKALVLLGDASLLRCTSPEWSDRRCLEVAEILLLQWKPEVAGQVLDELCARRSSMAPRERLRLDLMRGRVLLRAGRVAEALQVLEGAADAARDQPLPAATRAEALRVLARALRRAGDPDGAVRVLGEALESLGETSSSADALTARVYYQLGLAHEQRGHLGDARDALARALDMHGRGFGPDHIWCTTTGFELARLRHRLGEAGALSHIESALEALIGQTGPEHPWTRDCQRRLVELRANQAGSPL